MRYQLVIKSDNDPAYSHVIAVRDTERALERIEDGVGINLDWANFYTVIEEVEE